MFAPEAVKVELPPVQIAAVEAEAVIVAEELTETVTVSERVRALRALPASPTGRVADLVTLTEAPVKPPGCQS